jgi:hypothetical protein
MSARTHRLRPPRTAILFAALLLAVVFAADTREHCSVTCGRFKEDTCEIWDEAGAPSCECTIGDIGAYTRCRCADGSEPEGCRCSNAPHEACDSNNPQDDCGSCRCQC